MTSGAKRSPSAPLHLSVGAACRLPLAAQSASALDAAPHGRARRHPPQGVAGAHLLRFANGSTIESDTTTVHTPGGKSWKFTPSGTFGHYNRNLGPELVVLRIKLTAGVTKNISIWGRRNEANWPKCKLICRGGQVAGIYDDVESVALSPSAIDTWEQSGNLTLTSTEDGIVEVICKFWDEFGTGTGYFWVDDVTVA